MTDSQKSKDDINTRSILLIALIISVPFTIIELSYTYYLNYLEYNQLSKMNCNDLQSKILKQNFISWYNQDYAKNLYSKKCKS